MTARLEVRGLTRTFGALVVADRIDLTLEAGARTALIGPNGAGKTTLVNLISGALRPSAGEIRLDGRPIARLGLAGRVHAGLARSFQVNRLFRDMTVADNLRLAILNRARAGFGLFRRVADRPGLEAEVAGLLTRLHLADRAGQVVRNLAYGEQRLVELALALALKPRVLLLDEPAAGVPQGEAQVILDAVAQLPADLAVLLIEHDMDLVFRFARRIVVLVGGAVLTEGTPAEIAADARVREIYFGRGGHGRGRH